MWCAKRQMVNDICCLPMKEFAARQCHCRACLMFLAFLNLKSCRSWIPREFKSKHDSLPSCTEPFLATDRMNKGPLECRTCVSDRSETARLDMSCHCLSLLHPRMDLIRVIPVEPSYAPHITHTYIYTAYITHLLYTSLYSAVAAHARYSFHWHLGTNCLELNSFVERRCRASHLLMHVFVHFPADFGLVSR